MVEFQSHLVISSFDLVHLYMGARGGVLGAWDYVQVFALYSLAAAEVFKVVAI